MSKIDFTNISAKYEDYSLVQKSAAKVLLEILEIKDEDDVLDLGCGVGELTRQIRKNTKGKIIGIDPSEGMIKQAIEKSKSLEIAYEVKSAEELDYRECFDVIFCNSVFQWLKDPDKVVENCYVALRRDGRIGIQAPAKKIYSPNFIEAIKKVKENPRTKDVFAYFKAPWFFLETSDEYRNLFKKKGFKVAFSKIESVKAEYAPQEVFNIFFSGAAAGYLNQDFYDVKINESYISDFRNIVEESFAQQINNREKVELIFNRIFLMAVKD